MTKITLMIPSATPYTLVAQRLSQLAHDIGGEMILRGDGCWVVRMGHADDDDVHTEETI